MPVLMTSEAQGLTSAVYTQVLNALKASIQKAPGLILHTAHEVEGGFRVVELWQSKPESDQFFAKHVAPNLPAGVHPKRRTVELQSWVTPTSDGHTPSTIS
jgi:hypothetical protein